MEDKRSATASMQRQGRTRVFIRELRRNVFFSDSSRIRPNKLKPTGHVVLLAGTAGTAGSLAVVHQPNLRNVGSFGNSADRIDAASSGRSSTDKPLCEDLQGPVGKQVSSAESLRNRGVKSAGEDAITLMRSHLPRRSGRRISSITLTWRRFVNPKYALDRPQVDTGGHDGLRARPEEARADAKSDNAKST